MKRSILTWSAAALLTCAAGAVLAAVTPAVALDALTLAAAEQLFAQRNRELQLAQRSLEGAEADRISAAARPNPSLSVGTSNIIRQFPPGYEHNSLSRHFATQVGVSQTFERGNRRELRMDAAEYNLQATRGDAAEVGRQQRLALHAAYYELMLTQERARIAQENVQLYGRTLDAARLRLKAGDVSPADVSRISVDALRAQNDARAAQGEREKAQDALAYLIGAEREARGIRAADRLPAAAPLPPVANLDEILQRRPDVAAAERRVRAAEKSRDLARSLRSRDVTVGVQFTHSPVDPVANGTSANYWGLGVSVPLFVNYEYEGEIRKAEVELAAAQDGLERVRALAVGEIGRARADVEAAADRLVRFRGELAKDAERAAEAAEFAYAKGALGVIDLLDARRQLYAVRLEAAAAGADYARALAAWTAAVTPYNAATEERR